MSVLFFQEGVHLTGCNFDDYYHALFNLSRCHLSASSDARCSVYVLRAAASYKKQYFSTT